MFARMNEWHNECGQADKSETSKGRLKKSDQQFIVNPGESNKEVWWCVCVLCVFVVVLLFCRWLCGVVEYLLLWLCQCCCVERKNKLTVI